MLFVLLCACNDLLHTSVAGLLVRSQYPEGLTTGTSAQVFHGFPFSKTHAEMVPNTSSCYSMVLM